jgi:hypothetical protein
MEYNASVLNYWSLAETLFPTKWDLPKSSEL